MPRRKNERQKKGLAARPPKGPTKSAAYLKKTATAFIWRLIGGISVVVGATAIVFFWPRVTVEPSEPFDASPNPPIIFTITNTNVVPLAEIKPRLGLCAVGIIIGGVDEHPNPPFNICNEKSTGLLSPVDWHRKWLSVDEKTTVIWDDAFHNQTSGNIDYADIIITVAYQPWYVPWRNEKSFRFVTKKLSDGKLHWIPRPIFG